MTIAEWPDGVNQKFYNASYDYSDDREEVEFESGRRIFYKKNSVPRNTVSVSVSLDDWERDDRQNTEFLVFKYWLDHIGAYFPFHLPDLIKKDGSVNTYLLKEMPTWSGQRFKEVQLTLEEF